jgi:hypothetical protein
MRRTAALREPDEQELFEMQIVKSVYCARNFTGAHTSLPTNPYSLAEPTGQQLKTGVSLLQLNIIPQHAAVYY